ncbi:Cytochrome P450 734A6 [Linum grandiflorum]
MITFPELLVYNQSSQFFCDISIPNFLFDQNQTMSLAILIMIPAVAYTIFLLLLKVLWRPYMTQRHFLKQGISGPGYWPPITGNSSEMRRKMAEARSRKLLPPSSSGHHRGVLQSLVPAYCDWSTLYGKTFLYWFGFTPRLSFSDPLLIKEVLLSKDGTFERLDSDPLSKQLLGDGLSELKGQKWAVHRRIATLALNLEQAKSWMPKMADSTLKMFEKWEKGGEVEFEMDVHKEFHTLSADIISRTIFGSSFEKGLRFLPTKKNVERWRVNSGIRKSIRQLIKENNNNNKWDCDSSSRNMLDLLMSPHKNPDNGKEDKLDVEEIIEECKTFYFAGKETSANTLTWAIVLLAMHQDWQTKARQEILNVCGYNHLFTSQHLADLKLLTMILNETLRLYCPITTIQRRACRDVKVGQLQVPANTQVSLCVIAAHCDPGTWGDDADQFNPERFSKPRKHLAAFFPFGLGPRICAGQSFAMVEMKLALAMLLKRYSFQLSASYVHSPLQFMTVQPQYGAHILLRKIGE